MMKSPGILTFVILLFSHSLSAQNSKTKPAAKAPFALGVIDKIQSVQLSESRTLNIYLPDGYNDSAASYPVIYLLDGSANEDFVHVTGVVQFLVMIGKMPPSIIIGIANVDRRRDFTFPTTIPEDLKDFPTTGHSDKFMLFIEKELQPYVQKNYRTTAQKTIIGQSLGGLLAVEILLKKPELFTDYIIVSPSLWWDNESLLALAPGLLKAHPGKKANVYISVGSEGKIMEGDAAKLLELLNASGDKEMKTTLVPLPAEDHLTILHNAVYKGFEVLNPPKSK
jgi:predicted alpha/beta superfamily hydrolase